MTKAIFLVIGLSAFWLQSVAQTQVPSKTANPYKQVRRAIAKKQYDVALHLVDSLIKVEPSNFEAYRYKGEILRKTNKFEESIDTYSMAIRLAPRDTLSFLGRGEAKRFAGFHQSAIEDYCTALSFDSTEMATFFGRGSSYFALAQYEKALKDYNKCVKLRSKEAVLYLKRGQVFYDTKDFRNALKDFNKYLSLNPGDKHGASFFRGMTYVSLGDMGNRGVLDKAILDLNRALKAENNKSEVLRGLGIAYGLKRDSIKSQEYFKRALTANPENINAAFQYAISEQNYGHYSKADSLYKLVLAKVERPNADLYFNMAMTKQRLLDTLNAVGYFDKAIEVDSAREGFYNARIDLLFTNRKYDSIVRGDLDWLIEHSSLPRKKAEMLGVIGIMYIRDGRISDGLQYADSALTLYSGEPKHYLVRALAKSKMANDPVEVLTDIDTAMKLAPEDFGTYFFKASYYASIGRYEEACKTAKFGVRIGGSVDREVMAYFCKGKKPKNRAGLEVYIPLSPLLSDRSK